jgi:hypothetical protein
MDVWILDRGGKSAFLVYKLTIPNTHMYEALDVWWENLGQPA